MRSRIPAAHRLSRRARPTVAFVARVRHGLGTEGALPVAVAGIVLFASIASGGYASGIPGTPVGGPSGGGAEPRVTIGGFAGTEDGTDGASADGVGGPRADGDLSDEEVARLLQELGPEARALTHEPVTESGTATPIIDGPFLDDGTLVKPIAVDTSVADGSGLLRRYRVRSGDTLSGIAARFDVGMMTIWWANRLHSKDDLRVGQVLRVPTVDGLVVTVREGQTLASIAKANHVRASAIYEVNGLTDETLVMGQTLLVPGARGAAIKTPKPARTTPTGPRSGGSVRPPSHYRGGAFAWPVSGGNNYISQYFHYGHYAIDIAADYGSRVRSAAAGTVVFAGYRSNGGGYQVWIAHGSGLYTTYNHMSAISVGRGQGVGRGDSVGRVGCSGNCSGPHLHFEVWRGYPWDGGSYRVNPLIYY
ncbi:MAG TPA: LysM peptidoglycan-binding domain-containing protein [Candidatus Limnocylindrales bacterium]|jgi:murein DD-endopeptidase MepM/ murein hydrolase activator NlpD